MFKLLWKFSLASWQNLSNFQTSWKLSFLQFVHFTLSYTTHTNQTHMYVYIYIFIVCYVCFINICSNATLPTSLPIWTLHHIPSISIITGSIIWTIAWPTIYSHLWQNNFFNLAYIIMSVIIITIITSSNITISITMISIVNIHKRKTRHPPSIQVKPWRRIHGVIPGLQMSLNGTSRRCPSKYEPQQENTWCNSWPTYKPKREVPTSFFKRSSIRQEF